LQEFTRLNEGDFLEQFEDIDAWLNGLGFGCRDRLRQYKSNIEEMGKREARDTPGQLFSEVQNEGRLPEILASYAEAIEFVDTLSCLRKQAVAIPLLTLEKALNGSPDASREDQKSNSGRNAMFELVIASMAAKQNLQPILGTGNPDVEFLFRGRTFKIECKRVLSGKKILDKCSEAIHQLENCVELNKGDIGLVAISVSRQFHQGNGYYVAPSVDSGRQSLSSELHQRIEGLYDSLRKSIRPQCAGVVFHATVPIHISAVGFTALSFGILCSFSQEDTELLKVLAEKLRL
jgi:hypothetical protein